MRKYLLPLLLSSLLLAGCPTTEGPIPFESSGVVMPTPMGCNPDVDC